MSVGQVVRDVVEDAETHTQTHGDHSVPGIEEQEIIHVGDFSKVKMGEVKNYFQYWQERFNTTIPLFTYDKKKKNQYDPDQSS